MKALLPMFFILFTSYSFAQNYWEAINFPDSIHSRAINAEKEDVLFLASGGNNEFTGLFRSYDDGMTWEYINVKPPDTYLPIRSIHYNSDGILFLGTSLGIFRSYNDGDNFEKVYGGGISKISFSPDNETYAIGGDKILRSVNNGDDWDTLLYLNGNINFYDIDFGLNSEIYTVAGSFDGPNTGSGFHRSLDDGLTWENIGITDCHLQSVRVNENGGIIVGGFDGNGIYTSIDQGSTWIFISNIMADVLEKYDDDKLIAGTYINGNTGCWFSEDWGNNWISLVDTVIYPSVHQISISPSDFIYLQCENNHQLFKSINPLLGTNNHLPSVEIKLFPNPATNKLYIETESEFSIKHFIIYNQNGQKVLSGNLDNNSIDISKLFSGMYILELEMEKYFVRKKLIIE